MFTAGTHIEATPDDFLQWFTAWFQHHPPFLQSDNGSILEGRLSVGVEMGQHLIAAVNCEPAGASQDVGPAPFPSTFRILPVGLGRSVQLIVTGSTPALQPWLVQSILAITGQWPMDSSHAWFGEPPSSRSVLAALKIRAPLRIIESELQHWAASFRSAEVSSVGILARDDPRLAFATPGGHTVQRSWRITASLERGNFPWQAIERVTMQCEVSRIPGRYPNMLTLSCSGPPYREIHSLAADLIRRCQAIWDTQRIIPKAGGNRQNVVGKPGKRSEFHPSAQRALTIDDKPWELIPELSWDRPALRLWWLDHSCPAIAKQLHVSTKTITNRLSELRTMYGAGIVPTDHQRRKRREK